MICLTCPALAAQRDDALSELEIARRTINQYAADRVDLADTAARLTLENQTLTARVAWLVTRLMAFEIQPKQEEGQGI